jgi:hypothetical protein
MVEYGTVCRLSSLIYPRPQGLGLSGAYIRWMQNAVIIEIEDRCHPE